MLVSPWSIWIGTSINGCSVGHLLDCLRLSCSSLGIHISTRSNLWSTPISSSLTCQYPRQKIVIHQVVLLFTHPSACSPQILLLIFCKDQLFAPSTFATSSALTSLAISCSRNRFGDAEPVTAMVPLHLLFEMDLEFAFLICGAGNEG